MSDQIVPSNGAPIAPSVSASTAVDVWQDSEPRAPLPALARSPLERPIAAVRRYKWLMLAVIALATGAGFAATRLITPEYEVLARVIVSSDGPMDSRSAGPIRSASLFGADDWTQLLKSGAIADAVARKLSLFVKPGPGSKAEMFRGFSLANEAVLGSYHLVVNRTLKRWSLVREPQGTVVDSGAATDSIGRKLGFLWQLAPSWFNGTGEQKYPFTVVTPREAAVALVRRLQTGRGQQSDFLILTFRDPDNQLAATILNTWLNEFVDVAAALKRRKLVEYKNILGEQLQTAKASLDASELVLQSFRVNTITEPREGAPIAAGVQETRDPVMADFFEKSLAYDNIKQDVANLEAIVANLSRDSVPNDALLQIPSVAQGGVGARALQQAFTDYYAAEAELARHRVALEDLHPTVQADLANLRNLRTEKIPRLARDLLASLKQRQISDSMRIASASVNLRKIPQRTIEEEQLRRVRDGAATLAANLQSRYAEAQLAEASAAPDVKILDSAVAPLQPTKNTASRLLLMAIAGGVGAAVGLALLLDRLDGRLRYPDQATEDLGLPIAGTIPVLPKAGINQSSPEQMFQLVESFRTLRLAVAQASGQGVSVAVSSPAPSEGKSLISANLAMSFADAGFKTILVDGDTRRGALQALFNLNAAPGLTELLRGTHTLSEVIQPAWSDALSLIPCGTRHRRSPELLTSPRLHTLVAELRANYDVVIFDTPPLAAGIDGYSLASAAGSLLVALRVGQTRRRMAAEKLRMFERLPVNIIGAVLNGVKLAGAYEYYGYVPGYEAKDEESTSVELQVR